jgi:hypothetical protein
MTSSFKRGVEPCGDDGECGVWRHGALAEGDHVRVVMAARELRGLDRPAHRTADAVHLVGSDGLPVAGSAKHHSSLALARRNGLCRRANEARVVDWLLGVRSEVVHLVAEFRQEFRDELFVTVAGVIRCDGDLHGGSICQQGAAVSGLDGI